MAKIWNKIQWLILAWLISWGVKKELRPFIWAVAKQESGNEPTTNTKNNNFFSMKAGSRNYHSGVTEKGFCIYPSLWHGLHDFVDRAKQYYPTFASSYEGVTEVFEPKLFLTQLAQEHLYHNPSGWLYLGNPPEGGEVVRKPYFDFITGEGGEMWAKDSIIAYILDSVLFGLLALGVYAIYVTYFAKASYSSLKSKANGYFKPKSSFKGAKKYSGKKYQGNFKFNRYAKS